MPVPSFIFQARYQLSPFGSPEKLVLLLWLLLSIPFFLPVDRLPTMEEAAFRAVSILNGNSTPDYCHLCHIVLQNVDITQASFLDASVKDFETFLGHGDEQLLKACKASPDERGCDTLRIKIDEELKAYTNVVLEQMLTVSTTLEAYGTGLLAFIDKFNSLICSYVAVNKVKQAPPPSNSDAARRSIKLFRNHMWLRTYPDSGRHHAKCAELCEKRVKLRDRPMLYLLRLYVRFHVRPVILWLQAEHISTYIAVTFVIVMFTIVLRRLLAPMPMYPASSIASTGWAYRAVVDAMAQSGGSANSGAQNQPPGRATARGKPPGRRR